MSKFPPCPYFSPSFLSILQLVGLYKSYAAKYITVQKKDVLRIAGRSLVLRILRPSETKQKKSIHTTITDRHISSRK